MRTPSCFVGFLLMFALWTSLLPQTVSAAVAADNAAPASQTSAPVDAAKQFSEAVNLAEDGRTGEAFRIAKEAKQTGSPDKFLSVNYVNTLVTIADQKDKKLDVKILNEAIHEINEVKASKIAAGDRDPEIAYHTMVATGRLADALMPRSEQVASSLMLEEGAIAKKLKSNPMYPKDSLASLSEPVFHQAKAYAIQENPAEAFRCLEDAFALGFVQFDQVFEDEHLGTLKDQDRLTRITNEAKNRYIAKVDAWSKRVLREFQRFPFQLDVDGLTNGRMTHADFPGKVMVIDLWATWCTPCREAMPHFVELSHNLHREGVQVVGVSMDSPEDPTSARDTVKQFVTENGINFPIGLGTAAVTDQLPGKQLLPTTVFVDRSGNVRYIATGVHDIYQLTAISKVLAEEREPISTHRVD